MKIIEQMKMFQCDGRMMWLITNTWGKGNQKSVASTTSPESLESGVTVTATRVILPMITHDIYIERAKERDGVDQNNSIILQ